MPQLSTDFRCSAHGLPKHWNKGTPFGGQRTRRRFLEVPNARVNPASMMNFLRKRYGPDGNPVLDRLGEVVPQQNGWFRMAWLDYDHDTEAALSRAGWETAFHGSKMEALYSILYHGQLLESKDESRGERMLDDAPGVYVHNEDSARKASHYARFTPLHQDGVFWAVKWEGKVDRKLRVKPKRQTDQWVQKAAGVQLVALWFCGRTANEMRNSDPVACTWDPELEANPNSNDWISRATKDRRRFKRPLSHVHPLYIRHPLFFENN